MTCPRPEAMLRNENAVKHRPMQFRNDAKARNESASVNKDATERKTTQPKYDRSTVKREAKRVPPKEKHRATARCPICDKEFFQRSNMIRHLGSVHSKDEAGRKLDESTKRRYASYTAKKKLERKDRRKGRQTKEPKTPAIVPPSRSSSSASSPGRSWRPTRHSPPSAAEGRPPSVDPVDQVRVDPTMSSDSYSDDDYFVVVSEDDHRPQRSPQRVIEEASDQPSLTPSVRLPTEGRKPVRHKLPNVRSVRTMREARSPPPKLPRTDICRRRIVVTAARLAKAASENPSMLTKDLAEELAAEYSLTPEERRKCLHQLRGMRVAQRHLCGRIKRAFPMTRGAEEHEAFLD